MKGLKIYILQSSHWDREWYSPFQSFRYNLVEMLDALVEILEKDKDFGLFCTDGQTVLLEDYKEINPENAKKLKGFIEEGRVKVGPWYVMPDELLLSGESLIRNLAYGHKLAKEWGGEPWKFGYVNDIFGHIAQMPQIFKGFGIDGAYTSRGTGNTAKNQLVWVSPDGSECLLTVGPYSEFAFGYKKRRGTPEADEFLKKWVDAVIERTPAPVIFLSYTHDHARADKNSGQLLADLKRLYPDAEVGFFDLAQMVEELKPYKAEFPVIEGELNKPLDVRGGMIDNYPTLFGAISSYYPLKYLNDRCQNTLEKRIEPMAAVMDIEGAPLKRRFIELAYEYLMKNHPHDSICGCSIDRVHTDMLYRFDQVNDIANRLYDQFLFINKNFENDAVDSGLKIRLYNFTPNSFKGVRRIEVEFPQNYPTKRTGVAYYDPVNNFKILNAKGEEVEYQIIDIKRGVGVQATPYTEAARIKDIYTISLEAEIVSFGFTEYTVCPCKERKASRKTLNFGTNFAENDLVRLDIKENGRLNITDKATGKIYSDLNGYIDDGEVGDGWRHQDLKLDTVITDFGNGAQISVVSGGINEVVFKVEKEMLLPTHLNGITFKRGEEKAPLKIKTFVTLKRNDAAVTVETEIENNIKDHRLRVTFPTDIKGENYFASQAFCFVERKVGVDNSTDSWVEPYNLEQNTAGIVGKRNNMGEGLAVVSPFGIHECSCNNDERSTLSFTLLRAFDRVRRQKGAIGAQIQKTLKYKYAIMPLNEKVNYSDLLRLQHNLADTDISVTIPSALENKSLEKSYFKIDNKDIVLSMFKCAEDGNGYILRVFNASNTTQTAKVEFTPQIKTVYECNLNEENICECEVLGNSFKADFGKWQIRTFRVTSFVPVTPDK